MLPPGLWLARVPLGKSGKTAGIRLGATATDPGVGLGRTVNPGAGRLVVALLPPPYQRCLAAEKPLIFSLNCRF
jgi:hypothetical protein